MPAVARGAYIAPVVWNDPWRESLSAALPDNSHPPVSPALFARPAGPTGAGTWAACICFGPALHSGLTSFTSRAMRSTLRFALSLARSRRCRRSECATLASAPIEFVPRTVAGAPLDHTAIRNRFEASAHEGHRRAHPVTEGDAEIANVGMFDYVPVEVFPRPPRPISCLRIGCGQVAGAVRTRMQRPTNVPGAPLSQ